MAKYSVTLPIAGYATLEVEASSKDEAINEAMDACSFEDIESWDPLVKFNSGNVCHIPSPWEAEAELIEEDA
jgi:hypothetical protein